MRSVTLSPVTKLRTRIFWRMAGMLALTTVVFIAFIAGTIRFAFQPQERLRPLILINLKHYSDGLIGEIGTPPKESVLRKMTEDLGLDIQIEGPEGYHYESEKGLPQADALRAKIDYGNWGHTAPGISIGRYRGRSYLIRDTGTHHYIFSFSREIMGWLRIEVLLLVAGSISVILLGAFFSMRLLQRLTQAKERLLLDVSHELRSPLARIQVALGMMDQGIGGSVAAGSKGGVASASNSALASIADDVRELDRLLSQTLEAARLEDGNMGALKRAFDLKDVLRELKPNFEVVWPESVLNSSEAFTVMGNPEQIRIAIRNLIENAVKYSKESARPPEVLLSKLAGKIELRVSDFGVGIPKSERKKIFDPFYRTDTSRTRETGGYGLGLSLALRMVKANGGALVLEEGDTTTFRVSFKLESALGH